MSKTEVTEHYSDRNFESLSVAMDTKQLGADFVADSKAVGHILADNPADLADNLVKVDLYLNKADRLAGAHRRMAVVLEEDLLVGDMVRVVDFEESSRKEA